MSVIAINSSSRAVSVALRAGRDGSVEAALEMAGGHLDEELVAALRALLHPSVDAVVVLTGPGSYTGVRGGMAAALGLATTLGVPLHGLGTLAAIAAAAAREAAREVLAVADAGRGGVYVQGFLTGTGVLRALEQRPLRRIDAKTLSLQAGETVATTTTVDPAIGGTGHVTAAQALAAAVPAALRLAPLDGAHLSPIQL